MKKNILSLVLSCAALIGLACSTNFTKAAQGELSESTIDEISRIQGTSIKKAALEGEVKCSRTFVQTGTNSNGETCMRFATAVKGSIKSISYTRQIMGKDDVTLDVSTIYSGIQSGDDVYYYTDSGLSTNEADKGQYYWACYTIKFATETYKSYPIIAYATITGENDNSITSQYSNAAYNSVSSSSPYYITLKDGVGGAWMYMDISWSDPSYALTSFSEVSISLKTGETITKQAGSPGFLGVFVTNGNVANLQPSFLGAGFISEAETVATVKITKGAAEYTYTFTFVGKHIAEKTLYPAKDYSYTVETLASHTVSFDSQGGSECEDITVVEGKTYGTLPEPTKDNASFDGWYTEATGGVKVTAATAVELTDDATLYAHWVEKRIYDVTLGGGNGAWEKVVISWDDDTYDVATAVNAKNIDVKVTKPDNGVITLSGLIDRCEADNTNNKLCFGASMATAEFRNQKCKWEIQITTLNGKVYKLTFDALGDATYSIDNLEITEVVVEKVTVSFDAQNDTENTTKEYVVGKEYGELPAPTKEGFAFDGWYTEAEGGTKVTTSTIVTEAVTTLYAHWVSSSSTVGLDINTSTTKVEGAGVFVFVNNNQYDGLTLDDVTVTFNEFRSFDTESQGFVNMDKKVTKVRVNATELYFTIAAGFDASWNFELEFTVSFTKNGTNYSSVLVFRSNALASVDGVAI